MLNVNELSKTHASTLGYFYGSNNTLATETNLREARTPVSKYPYARVIYNNWGEVEEASTPGDYTNIGSDHTSKVMTSVVLRSADIYAHQYFVIRGQLFDQQPEEKYIQTTTTDAQGQSTRTITNAEGQTLITEHLASHDQTWYFYNDRGQVVAVVPH